MNLCLVWFANFFLSTHAPTSYKLLSKLNIYIHLIRVENPKLKNLWCPKKDEEGEQGDDLEDENEEDDEENSED